MTKNVLLLASGQSSKIYHELDLTQFTVVAINNAHLIANDEMKFWVRPKNYSGNQYRGTAPKISNPEYGPLLDCYGGAKACGYSITLCAAYWSLRYLKPDNIMFLGADMNYQPDEQGNTHFYGVGFDIKNNGIPDPFKMAMMKKKNQSWSDEEYIFEIYNRFDAISKNGFPRITDHKPANVYNLSDDPDSLLPYQRLDWRQFKKET
jgi:hypothetical protein